MVVMTPRETWTDQRLDDLNKKVDKGFERVDKDIRELRGEMNDRFDSIGDRFDSIDARFDRMQHTLFAGTIAVVVALIGSSASLIGVAVF